jgi:hypothetical protein
LRTKTEIWLRALIAAAITGASSSGLSALGIVGAQVIGIKVAQLDLKQLGTMCLAGGIVGVMSYLKQSPVPPESTGNTDIITKQQTETKTT